MVRASVAKLLNVAGAIMVVAVLAVWAYSFIVQPLIEGKWLAVMVFVAGCFFWAALREVARRKAESTDYRRH
jgi:zinc transporter ZupT